MVFTTLDLNNIIKSRRFLLTARIMIRKKLNDNLVDIIMNFTDIIKIPKEEINKMYGLITLLTNRIYYMYTNEISDWMNFYNHNSYQEITWCAKKFDINKLYDIYFIILYLLKNKFNINHYQNNKELKFIITDNNKETPFRISLNNINNNKIVLFKLNKDLL